MRGRGAGTDIREGIDPSTVRTLARGPGTDTRRWCEMGTVATLDDETGDWDFKDKRAILNGPEGVEVDVRLEPLDQLVTCRYAGVQAGEVTIFAPIRPGDIVAVSLPQGGNAQPVIFAILQSRSKRQPLGTDRKPLFDNQRLLVHAKTVPIDIRTAGGTQVLIEQNGKVTVTGKDIKLGDGTATEQLVLGTTYRSAEGNVDTAWQTFLTALATFVPLCVGPSPAQIATMLAAITAMETSLTAFEADSSKYLSPVSKTK